MDVVTPPGGPASRAPKQDRSRATRLRLLEAAAACLAEHGWSGSTVTVVAERAGVSRGAAQHHFPTREDLFTGAIEYVSQEWRSSLGGQVGTLPEPGPRRTRAVVELLVGAFTSPLFRAAVHLWVAAADLPQDDALRQRVAGLENRIGREAHRLAVEFLEADESVAGVRETVQATLDMARGLGLATLLRDDTVRRTAVVAQWSRVLEGVLRPPAGSG